MHFDILNR